MADGEDRLEKTTLLVRLAFSDRDFFVRLITEPREALEWAVEEGKIELDGREIERIAAAVAQRTEDLDQDQVQSIWGRWRAFEDWPVGPPDAFNWRF